MPGKSEIIKDRHGEFQFHVRSKSGEILAFGQSYPTRAKAKEGVTETLKAISKARIYDLTREAE